MINRQYYRLLMHIILFTIVLILNITHNHVQLDEMNVTTEDNRLFVFMLTYKLYIKPILFITDVMLLTYVPYVVDGLLEYMYKGETKKNDNEYTLLNKI